MSTQKNVLENMLEDQLRKLSVRILLKDEKNRYMPQGSGLLYLTDDGGYVLTACHVLDKFGAVCSLLRKAITLAASNLSTAFSSLAYVSIRSE